MKYTVILEKGDKFGYVAKVPTLKGCVSQGRTKADALKNVKEAIEAYVWGHTAPAAAVTGEWKPLS